MIREPFETGDELLFDLIPARDLAAIFADQIESVFTKDGENPQVLVFARLGLSGPSRFDTVHARMVARIWSNRLIHCSEHRIGVLLYQPFSLTWVEVQLALEMGTSDRDIRRDCQLLLATLGVDAQWIQNQVRAKTLLHIYSVSLKAALHSWKRAQCSTSGHAHLLADLPYWCTRYHEPFAP